MTLADLLPDGMSLEDILVIMSSLSVLVSVLAVWFAFLHRDVAAQRARLIADQRRELRSSVMGPQRREVHQPSMHFFRHEMGRASSSDRAVQYCKVPAVPL